MAETAFGTQFAPTMAVCRAVDGVFGEPVLDPVEPLALHPGSHVLHYGSACFEGLKAHRGVDGVVRTFRADRHARRMQASARLAHLPEPDPALVHRMIVETVRANLDHVPQPPASLYLRPVLLGTDENIGAAAAPSRDALLYVLASPVGDYFAGGARPLSVAVERGLPRSTPQFGRVKAGANYVMALGPTLDARREWGVDQVLFCPDGVVGETGASNVLLLTGDRVVTPALDGTFLEGITRDALLTLARDLGLTVEEREVGVEELLAWAARPDAEIALSGTAAILAGVGTLVAGGEPVPVGSGQVGPTTTRLRQALEAVQRAEAEDRHGWLLAVEPAGRATA